MNHEIFFENFELLIDAPNGVQKLRELILQLAVQGKLVPQDPNDEPAMILINSIKAKKNRLAREKKIKNNNLPHIQTEEMPYNLPKGWNWIRLRDLGQTQTGTTPSKNNSEFFGKDYPFLKPGDISNNLIDYNNDGLSQLGMKNGRFIKAGSILMVCIGGSIGKVNFVDRDCSCNQQINVLTPYLDLDSRLFSYFMRSRYFQNEVKSRAPQTTLPILSKGKWELIPLPLPPHDEQNRILSKIKQLMALCDQLEARQEKKHEKRLLLNNAALDKLLTAPTPGEFAQHWQRICDNFNLLYDAPETVGQLRQAILQLAVQGKLVAQDPGDETIEVVLENIDRNKKKDLKPIQEKEIPYKIPDGWKWIRLGDIFSLKTGATPSTKNPIYWNGNIRWLKSGDVNKGEIFDCEGRITEIGMKNSNCKILPSDSVLIALNGQGKTRGTVAMLRIEATCNQSLVAMISENKDHFVPEYLFNYLRANYMNIRNITGHKQRRGLNMKIISNLLVALPPSNEQKRIVAKINQLMPFCDELEVGLVQAQTDGGKLMEAVVHHVLAA